MSGIPAKTLREKTSLELRDQIMLERKRMFDGVVKNASGEAIKPHEKRHGRRFIARMQGLVSERVRRRDVEQQIAKLSPPAQGASPRLLRLLRVLEERCAAIQAERAKPEGQRKDLPLPSYKRLKAQAGPLDRAADRAVLKLAEAKRLQCALAREDAGQNG